MIKLFSLIFYLCLLPVTGTEKRGRLREYLALPSKSSAQIQFENQKLQELMSHLLYLNSCDNYPNKCPHICLHLIVKQHSIPPGLE